MSQTLIQNTYIVASASMKENIYDGIAINLSPSAYYILYKCGAIKNNDIISNIESAEGSGFSIYYDYENVDVLFASYCNFIIHIKENHTLQLDDIKGIRRALFYITRRLSVSELIVIADGNATKEAFLQFLSVFSDYRILIRNTKNIIDNIIDIVCKDGKRIDIDFIGYHYELKKDTFLKTHICFDIPVAKDMEFAVRYVNTLIDLTLMDIEDITDIDTWYNLIDIVYSNKDSFANRDIELEFIKASRLCRKVNNIDVMKLFREPIANGLVDLDFVELSIL